MAFLYHAPRHIDGNYCVFPSDMRSWEASEIDEISGRGHELMEIAGREVAQLVLANHPEVREVLIFCGQGNNGGDGLTAAYYLERCGIEVQLFVFDEAVSKTPDAQSMFERVRHIPRIVLRSSTDAGRILEWARRRDILVIDAIFGTGYHPSHNPLMTRVYQCISALSCKVVSIDIPSGIDAQTGYRGAIDDETPPKALVADETVTFGAPKTGHFFGEGPTHCGELYCVDIGLRPWHEGASRTLILTDEYCQRMLWREFERPFDVHKGRCGHVAIVGGMMSMKGASCMAGKAALRAGCGLVTVAARQFIQAPDEIMVAPICGENGILNRDALHQVFDKADCILVGPGLGRDDTALEILRECTQFGGRVVLDADALWALPQLDTKFRSSEVYATPHPAEAARLADVSPRQILYNPLGFAHQIVDKFNVTTILKSHATVIATHKGNAIRYGVCPYPNPALATAGSGDVLAGILAGILTQTRCGAVSKWYDAFENAALAVNCHSQAGRNAARIRGNSLCASDIIDCIHIG